MKNYIMAGVLFGALCLCPMTLQASMSVVLQQRDGLVSIVDKGEHMVTGDNVTFLLANEGVSSKASKLLGLRAHILYYESAEKKYCVDLRSAAESAFEIGQAGN